MTFGEAIEYAKIGRKVARYGWNGKDMFVYLATAGHLQPFLAIHAADGHDYSWVASQPDMLTDDWKLVA